MRKRIKSFYHGENCPRLFWPANRLICLDFIGNSSRKEYFWHIAYMIFLWHQLLHNLIWLDIANILTHKLEIDNDHICWYIDWFRYSKLVGSVESENFLSLIFKSPIMAWIITFFFLIHGYICGPCIDLLKTITSP